MVRVDTLVLFLASNIILDYHMWPLLCQNMFLLHPFVDDFCCERMLYFVTWYFFYIYWDHITFFILLCGISCLFICVCWPWVSEINLTWLWWKVPLMCCWIRVANILLRFLYLYSSEISVYTFLSLYCLYLALVLE